MRTKKREQKRPVIIAVLKVLEKYSDSEHLLKQKDIIKHLQEDFDISLERKAVSNNIRVLMSMGYEIVQQKRSGVYLAKRKFSKTELRFLIDGVLESRHIELEAKNDLIKRLKMLGGENFVSNLEGVHNMNIEAPEKYNRDFIETIEVLQNCIDNGWRLRMRYCKYNIDKELESTTPTRRIISPYKIVVHNQKYYVVANYPKYDNLVFLRIDKIHDIALTKEPIRPITEIKGCENGLDLDLIKTRLPYLLPDEPQKIKLRCKMYMTDDLIDWFGKDIKFEKEDDNFFIAAFYSSPKAMEYWIMQYNQHVEVIEPFELREKIKANIRDMIIKYFSRNTYNYFKRLMDRESVHAKRREEAENIVEGSPLTSDSLLNRKRERMHK